MTMKNNHPDVWDEFCRWQRAHHTIHINEEQLMEKFKKERGENNG